MPSDPLSIFIMIVSVLLVGMAKGGIIGLGMLAMPLMAMIFPPVEAGAILMPLLVVQDSFGMWLYRKRWHRKIVAWMMPGAVCGVAAAAYFASIMPVKAILVILGSISAVFGLWRVWVSWRDMPIKMRTAKEWPGLVFGFFSGFTSQIAHAGAPPFHIWVIPKNLSHIQFAGTAIMFFGFVNWLKVPAFIALGAFTRETLILSLFLTPVALLSTLVGARLVSLIHGRSFFIFANMMLALVGMKLIWDAIA